MERPELDAAIDALIDAHRDCCLWHIRRDYYPRTDAERARMLTEIQRHADRATFADAGRLKRWLSPTSNGG